MVVEAPSREYCEARIRAGVITQDACDTLTEADVGERMEREGLIRGGIHLRIDAEGHHIPMSEVTAAGP